MTKTEARWKLLDGLLAYQLGWKEYGIDELSLVAENVDRFNDYSRTKKKGVSYDPTRIRPNDGQDETENAA